MSPPGERRERRIGLELKVVAVLLAIALAPLAVSAILIEQIGEVAQNFASNQAARLRPSLEQAERAYHELVATKKQLYRTTAARAALAPELGAALATGDRAALERALAADVGDAPELLRAEVDQAGAVLATASRAASAPALPAHYKELAERQDLAGGATLVLTFAADLALNEDFQAIGKVLAESRKVDTVRATLPSSYRTAFLLLVGGVVVVVTAIGLVLARRLTRRIARLVRGTRAVARGDLTARVEVHGRDELGELGGAFNRMVEDLVSDREQILYLQRMSAWQDVARHLAHEIKNPLTPIQLAVQQLASSYDGADPRHAKLLVDAEEIVREEIAGLRRLVDAFSTLGRLPRIDARPLDLATVVEDLARDPVFAEHLVAAPPAAPVRVRGDRLLLRRVLANLLENGLHAGRAAGKPGKVVVGWRAEPGRGRAVMTIDDEGAGIDPALGERIFEPYVTGKETGTGLGLPIAKKIALEHRGGLELAADPAPTGGARFVLEVPLEDASTVSQA